MKSTLVTLFIMLGFIWGQGVNPLKWYPIAEENNFVNQAFEKVCIGTDILNSDTENCDPLWGQYQNEVDVDNDGNMDIISQVYEDWHSGFSGIGILRNINKQDSNNVFILDNVFRQCGSHGGISVGYFNSDEFIDIYFSTANYHGPDWMKPDLDCLQQDFFYMGSNQGFTQDTVSNSLPLEDSMFVFGSNQHVFDINNDGIDEVLVSGSVPNKGQVIMILSYEEGIQNFKISNIIYPQIENAGFQEWTYSDFNGDGWKDLLTATNYRETPESPVGNAFNLFYGTENGINIDSLILVGTYIDIYGVMQLTNEESITPIDYDQDGDSELLIWWAYSFDDQHATIAKDSIPKGELRLYDFIGDSLIDITQKAFIQEDNKDFNSPGNGVFIKDLNNDGKEDILFSTAWCLEKLNISGIDPGDPGYLADGDCATFALNIEGKFQLYNVAPQLGRDQFSPQIFSVELSRYENDPIIYLSATVENPIWNYSNQVDKIILNEDIDSVNADTLQAISWGGDIVADNYRVQLSSDGFDLDFILDSVTTDTMIIINSLLLESEYYIRVRGENEAGEGLWSDTLTFMTKLLDISKDSYLPKEFLLHHNFPNPFNPLTAIKYELPVQSFVVLNVFNLLGKKVKTLISKNQSQGYYSVDWDAKNEFGVSVPAGVYFYQLQTEEFTKTRKMVLLK